MSVTTTLHASSLPIQSVTVYNDRAQIRRELKTNLPTGFHELLIENVANTIDDDSIRFDGSGNARIHEVKFKKEHVVREDIDSPAIRALVEERNELVAEKDEKEDRKTRLKRQLDAMNGMASEMGCSEKKLVFNDDVARNMDDFFVFYDQRVARLQQDLREADKPITKLKERIEKLGRKIEDLRKGASVSRNIIVSVEVLKRGELTFILSYQVRSACWRPTYDIRVDCANKINEKTVMKLDYFAQIEQDSGEEWTDAAVLLSTAQPCLGGNIPKLGTLNASLYNPRAVTHHHIEYNRCRSRSRGVSAPRDDRSRDCSSGSSDESSMRHVGMTANQQMLATEFQIPGLKTIPSDNSEHKMLITQIDFDPSLLHECVPKKTTNVFLSATVINNSEFPLLPGKAAVYFNHSFVAKTRLEAVAPGEKFTCSLGVDSAVKVTYKRAHKNNTEGGMFNKQATVTNIQQITIQNNKQEPINITVREHIPKATDEKVKVKVLQPSIDVPKNEDESTRKAINGPASCCVLNAEHNLEWTMTIEASKKKELTVEWKIEYPGTKRLEYNETY